MFMASLTRCFVSAKRLLVEMKRCVRLAKNISLVFEICLPFVYKIKIASY